MSGFFQPSLILIVVALSCLNTTESAVEHKVAIATKRTASREQAVNSSSSSSSSTADISFWDPELYSKMKYSVVRITSVSDSERSVGSGFFVNAKKTMANEHDFTIVTNAHVVRNAAIVKVQLPSLGQHSFEATVPMICFLFDLAVVKLKDPSELREKLEARKVEVHLLDLQSKYVRMGMKVAAFGFPLGSEDLKLSEGTIAGAEEVEENLVFQSTAAISPGNSGGPLLVFRNSDPVLKTVVGVNFASSSSKEAQNLNYVVPSFRIVQLLVAYTRMVAADNSTLDRFGIGTLEHMEWRIAPLGVVFTQSTEAQLKEGNCTGVQLGRFEPYSAFRWAEPPIQEKSFLTKVSHTELDIFGMGKDEAYVAQYVSFGDLIRFQRNLVDPVKVTVCIRGKYTQHDLNLAWNTSRYQKGIPYVYESNYDKLASNYEYFAGVKMAQLTFNQVAKLVEQSGQSESAATFSRFLLQENRVKPRIVITSCEPGSICEGIVGPGMLVESINSCNVSTMSDLRDCFKPSNGSAWRLVTEAGQMLVVDFEEQLLKSFKEVAESMQTLTPAVRSSVAKVMGNLRASKASDNSTAAGTADLHEKVSVRISDSHEHTTRYIRKALDSMASLAVDPSGSVAEDE
eukprot:TRINITY_DN109137_c0_g1_i1.p1 TRINITY_DN109137_c0_g1~~TRINITY_DN109137_c0_g1_i1.p1  ORF type:complete len:627 (+),score=108.77 TRINITY_DN109137_c0_g1_i1:132-2012(+)